MKRLLSALIGFVLILGLGQPAHGASGSVEGKDGVLYSDCRNYPISYSLYLPDAVHWSLDISVNGPDGLLAGSDFVWGDLETSGTAAVFLCGGLDEPGLYTIDASGSWSDYDWNSYDFSLPSSTFSLRSPKTRTSVSALTRGRLRVAVKDERPSGYFSTAYPRILIQVKQAGRWRTKKRVLLGESGRQTFRLARFAGRQARVITKATDEYSRSTSRTVRIRR